MPGVAPSLLSAPQHVMGCAVLKAGDLLLLSESRFTMQRELGSEVERENTTRAEPQEVQAHLGPTPGPSLTSARLPKGHTT